MIYLKFNRKPITFKRAAERSCGYVIDTCGDKDLLSYTNKGATALRDALLNKRLSGSSISRIFGTVRSVVNFAMAELGIDRTPPFNGVYCDRDGVYCDRDKGAQQRSPLPRKSLVSVQNEGKCIDDELRWVVALVSDTGMRLAEAAGLTAQDIKLNAEVPHVLVQEHPWQRLKTKSNTRVAKPKLFSPPGSAPTPNRQCPRAPSK